MFPFAIEFVVMRSSLVVVAIAIGGSSSGRSGRAAV